MKNQTFVLQKFEADEGKVFDWKDLSKHVSVQDDKEVQEHLYAKVIFLSANDNIENYVEVDYETED